MTTPHRPGGQNETVPTDRRRSPDVNRERRYSAEETRRRGDEIYKRDIKPTLTEDQHGHYVSIDVNSGSWAIADTFRAAIDELYAQHPEATDVWSLRVGYRTLRRMRGSTQDRCRPRPPSRVAEASSGARNAPKITCRPPESQG